VAGLIRRHRAAIGSPWRKLNPARQALLVLAYLRKGDTFAELAAGFDVGTTTAWRYVSETAALLAARAPKLRTAVRDAARAGYAYVVLDGTLIPVDRVAADRPFYSGKHKKHGMNLQVIASPGGDILWVSGELAGVVHPILVFGLERNASSQLIRCVASRLDSVTSTLAVAASAHCRSSTMISNGARCAAFSRASCSSRSSQSRWSGDRLRS
jgi:hypothetical protein